MTRRALDRIEHHTQVTEIHRARIKAKRLRYLVDAVDAHTAGGERCLRQLRLLQDTLGDLHDAQVLGAQLDPLLMPRRRRGEPWRPALRDLRALRAALRRRELAAFRNSLNLLASAEVAAAWRYIERLPARLEATSATRMRPTPASPARRTAKARADLTP